MIKQADFLFLYINDWFCRLETEDSVDAYLSILTNAKKDVRSTEINQAFNIFQIGY